MLSRCAEAAAKNLQAMNPLVKVSSCPGAALSSSSWAPHLLQQHDLAIAFGLPLLQLLEMNAACREAGIGFMAAAAAGPGGWFFVDLGQHQYQPKVGWQLLLQLLQQCFAEASAEAIAAAETGTPAAAAAAAVLGCTAFYHSVMHLTVLRYCTAVLYCGTVLRYCTAVLYCSATVPVVGHVTAYPE